MSGASPIIGRDLHEIAERAAADLAWLDGKRVLVTGGAGFLMSYLVDLLAARADAVPAGEKPHVVVMDTFTTAGRDRLAHLASHAQVELRTVDVATVALAEPFDVVVHGASIASPVAYRRMPLRTIEANALGTWTLLRAAEERPPAVFVLMSTSEIYGDPDSGHVPTPETYPGLVSSTGPRACYDESKRFA